MIKDNTPTLELAAHIAATSPELEVRRHARRIGQRLAAIPMAAILDRVPGDTIEARCRAIRVTRTTYYKWLKGQTRPRDRFARAISSLTGISVAEIRGRWPPPARPGD